ncbi:MAG: hypothetical protein JWR11_5431 [Mycobacterium sp.]|nr:hypothetical protein [Mycobacterium sp.]
MKTGRLRDACISLAGTTLLLVITALGGLPSAHAAPGDGGAVAVAPSLALTELGVSSRLSFYGEQGTETVVLPVPRGLAPTELTAIVEPPINVRSAVLTVSQADRAIARVDLPLQGPAPITIPLAGVQVVDNSVTLLVRTYVLPVEGYCLDPVNPLRLNGLALRYGGSELPPTTVADFLPPVLRKLTVYLPAAPSQAEADAVVRLATAVVSHYGQQFPEVETVALPDGQSAPQNPSQPLERQIVVTKGGYGGLSLLGADGVPALLVSGSDNELANQSRLLSSGLARMALASKAVTGPLKPTPQLPRDVTTIRELGQPGVNAVALNPQVGIGLDQTRLGRSAQRLRVHLIGSYTPLPSSVGGQIVASIAGDTVDRWAAESSGAIDRWIDVPDRLLQRYTTLNVAVDIAGSTGQCGDFQPVTLTIDGSTVVQSAAASPPVPAGLQSLPQALMPRVEVGIGSNSFADTARAVAIMVGLQRLSVLPIDPAVVPLQDAAKSANSAVLIAADGFSDDKLKLPVDVDEGTITVDGTDGSNDPVTLTLDPRLKFGSLQTIVDGSRTVVVATSNGAPGQLDALLTWINADPRRFSELGGTVIIAPTERDPFAVTVGAAPEVAAEQGDSVPYWAIGAVIVALVALGAGLIYLRTRRSASS